MTRRSLLLFGLLFCWLSLLAQGWQRTYPYTGFDGAPSAAFELKPTLDGGYLLAGEVDWPTGAIRHYLRLIKVDGSGAPQWERTYGEGEIAHVKVAGLATLPDGGYALGLTTGISFTANVGILRIDAFGDTLWASPIPVSGYAHAMVPALDGGFLLAGRTALDFALDRPMLFKFGADGSTEWEQEYAIVNGGEFYDVKRVSAGGYVAAGTGDGQSLLVRFDDAGDLVWNQAFSFGSGCRAYVVVEAPDGGFLLAGSADGFAGPGPVVWKTDAQGNEEWMTFLSQGIGEVTGLQVLSDGGVAVTGSLTNLFQNQNGFLARIDAAGTETWLQSFDALGGSAGGRGLLADPDGGFLVAGMKGGEAWLMQTDAQGNAVSNWVEGNVWRSTTCDTDDVIGPMAGWTVRLRSAADTLYTLTDTLGNFRFQVDTGSYFLQVLPPNLLWSACDGEIPLQLTEFYDTTYQSLQIASAGAFCPLMTVDVSTPFMRRCFDNTFSVQYCNEGTENAFGAFVEVTLDPFLELVSSQTPFTDLGGNRYAFGIGDLPVGDCGSFQFTAYLDCENVVPGQTHCVEAHIFPDSSCVAAADQAVIDLAPGCESDSVSFLLRNEGDAPMQMEAQFIVIEDDVMLSVDPFELGVGEERTVKYPANGSTWRLEAPRRPDDPFTDLITATIEGCDADDDDDFSVGFVNQFVLFTGSPSVDVECQENIGSYDPNDKRAFPAGYGEDHFIEAGTPLEYHIRFQNTGTDTAFRVEIVDTLSQWLDPATLRPGASSHAYSWELTGEGVLHFLFDPIALPDSNVNEPASHGFVKFYLETRPDAPVDVLVENRAAIYFDFNAPVFTNTWFHTIGENFLRTVSVRPDPSAAVALRVYPNPFVQEATLEVEGAEIRHGALRLFDSRGRLVRNLQVNGNRVQLSAGGLAKGVYFYRLESAGRLLGSGRLVVQ